ncbi:MAG: helix-turn-helix transcriptional regulator [Bacteroidetes bacterium]|nr:helix-turn-helix transcriptional regulator [Bacteroidota bacterium]
MVDIQKNIEAILRQKNISGAEMARKMGLKNRQGFYQMIRSKNIELESLDRISNALDVSISQLVKDDSYLVPEIIKVPNDNLKVTIQIELDPNPGSNSIKMIFGQAFLDQLKK